MGTCNNNVSLKYSFQKAHSSLALSCCDAEVEYELESEYAFEQLRLLTHKGEAFFVLFMKKIFGVQYDKESIGKLFDVLVQDDRSIIPKIVLLTNKNKNDYADKNHDIIGGKINGHYAAYDNEKHEIVVSYWFMCKAIYQNPKRGALLMALVEEFGHHVHYLLSDVYSSIGREVKGDVGAKFSWNVVGVNALEEKNQKFAKVNGADLVWEFQNLNCTLKQYAEKIRQNKDDNSSERFSYFGDHMAHDDETKEISHSASKEEGHGHKEIAEKALTVILKDMFPDLEKDSIDLIIDRIYLGNWMRDWSQLVDPQVIRPMSNAIVGVASAPVPLYAMGADAVTKLGVFKEWWSGIEWDSDATQAQKVTVTHQPKTVHERNSVLGIEYPSVVPSGVDDFPSIDPKPSNSSRKEKFDLHYSLGFVSFDFKVYPLMWSRELMTNIVALLATKQFVLKDDKHLIHENYKDALDILKEDFVEINPKNLGVYRPDEHIDNPKVDSQKPEMENDKLNTSEENANNTGFVPYPKVEKGELEVGVVYGMKNYIRTSAFDADSKEFSTKKTAYKLLLEKLDKATKQKNPNFHTKDDANREAMLEFGAALHIVEDYFAHTNYVEVCLVKLGYDRVYPWVGMVKSKDGRVFDYNHFAQLTPHEADEYLALCPTAIAQTEQAHFGQKQINVAPYIPVVTGTFSRLDMLASLLPKIFKLLKGVNEQGEIELTPGKRTLADVATYYIAKELDEMVDKYAGKLEEGLDVLRKVNMVDIKIPDKIPNFEKSFDAYLLHRDVLYGEINHDLEDLDEEQKKEIYRRLGEIKSKMNVGLYLIVFAVVGQMHELHNMFEKQIENMEKSDAKGDFGMGTDPSHTHVAKDDKHKILHELSAQLAIEASTRVSRIMFNVWQNKADYVDLENEVDMIFQHPVKSTWQDEMVATWAEENKTKICEISTPAIVPKAIVKGIEEYDEFLDTLIKTVREANGGIGSEMHRTGDPVDSLKNTLNSVAQDLQKLKKQVKALKRDKDAPPLTAGTDMAKWLELDRDEILAKFEKSEDEGKTWIDAKVDELIDKAKDKLTGVDVRKEKVGYIESTIREYISSIEDSAREVVSEVDVLSIEEQITQAKAKGKTLTSRAVNLYPKYQSVYYRNEVCYKEGVSYIIGSFKYNSSEMNDETRKTAFKMINYIETSLRKKQKEGKLISDFSLEIVGHTDKRGKPEYNRGLGEKRAQSVMTFLKTSTIWKNKKMSIMSKGESEIWSDDKHKPNRRAEVRVIYEKVEDMWSGL
jgi:outer membrane protein OmpA-like peptidoglycan-associated protein